jgi:nucleoside-diphosphate-sugar epimerase
VVEACIELGIKQPVFTSSASVVFDGRHIKGTAFPCRTRQPHTAHAHAHRTRQPHTPHAHTC